MRYCRPIATLAGLWLAACSSVPSPEVRERWDKGAMVAAADPRAVEAGLEVLRDGGTAVDAAIAVHLVLGLVEPQSSGLGGGAFMLVYTRQTGELTVYDGRETAPSAATSELFIGPDGEVLDYVTSWQSGRSVGVPGQVALYKAAHDDHGALDWSRLFAPATELAETGFVVSPRLADLLANDRRRWAVRLVDPDVSASDYFYPGGEPLRAGDVRINAAYASLMRRLAAEGPDAFYSGRIAQAMVREVGAGPNPGQMSLRDLNSYRVKRRDPLCGAFREMTVCSAPAPSSGGVAQNMILQLYDVFDGGDGQNWQAFVDAQRLAYADRDHYLADADFVFVPEAELIDPRYIAVRAGERFAPDATPTPGDPGAVLNAEPYITLWGRDGPGGGAGTTHISIVDQYGNAVAMTATVESAFGSSRWVAEGGFLLNNELTDFARNPTAGGRPVANAPAPGKRPRSSMSPTIVFDAEGDLFMVTGSPGGNSIIAYVSKTLIGVLDWGLDAQAAADLPNVVARGARVNVEVDRPGGQAIADMLKAKGYDVAERRGENSGIHLVIVRDTGLEGGADPRREGVARGQD